MLFIFLGVCLLIAGIVMRVRLKHLQKNPPAPPPKEEPPPVPQIAAPSFLLRSMKSHAFNAWVLPEAYNSNYHVFGITIFVPESEWSADRMAQFEIIVRSSLTESVIAAAAKNPVPNKAAILEAAKTGIAHAVFNRSPFREANFEITSYDISNTKPPDPTPPDTKSKSYGGGYWTISRGGTV